MQASANTKQSGRRAGGRANFPCRTQTNKIQSQRGKTFQFHYAPLALDHTKKESEMLTFDPAEKQAVEKHLSEVEFKTPKSIAY